MTRKERVMKSVRGNVKSIFMSLALVLLAAFALGFNTKAAGRVDSSVTTKDEAGPGKKVTFDVSVRNHTTGTTYEPGKLGLTVVTLDAGNEKLDNMEIMGDVEVSADETMAFNTKAIAPGDELKTQIEVKSMPAAWSDKSSFIVVVTDETNKTISDMGIYTKLPYPDVNSQDWFYNYAALMNRMDVMTGMADGTFSPSVGLSRAQVATTLWRIAGSPDVPYDGSKFPDVPDGKFYTKAVMWANSVGVVKGYNEGGFGPADGITREQMAEMMYRFEMLTHPDAAATGDLTQFPDGDGVTPFAVDGMKWAVGTGLISGNGVGTYATLNPQGTTDRAACAAILSRFYMHSSKMDIEKAGTAQIMMQSN